MPLKTERLELRLDEGVLDKIDEWRSNQPDSPTRSEAARRLIMGGLRPVRTRGSEFNDGEMMIISLLCDLHRGMAPPRAELDPEFISRAVGEGHHWALEFRYQGIFPHRTDSPAEVTEVLNFLDMWDCIEEGHERLSDQTKEQVKEGAARYGSAMFPGFDGNTESNYLSIARFLVERLERFPRFAGRKLDSHFPTVEEYRRMHQVFGQLRPALTMNRAKLAASQIIDILRAAE